MRKKCYSIGSQNSEGMKSKNPEAGFHEADIARTLDTQGADPSGYQGGIAVVEIFGEAQGGVRRLEYGAGTVGSLCARNSRGVGSQYVQEGKLVIEAWEEPEA